MDSKRDKNIDIVAGIMILNMVIFHFSKFDAQIYLSFFMPWFFYKSGMYYQESNNYECIKHCKKLFVPLIVFSFIGSLEQNIVLYISGDRDIVHYTITHIKDFCHVGADPGNNALWFLTSICLVKIVYNGLKRAKINSIIILIFSILLNFVILQFHSPLIPVYIHNFGICLFFYTTGTLFSKIQYEMKVWIPALCITSLIAFTCISECDIYFNKVITGYYYIWVVYSMVACVVINVITKMLPKRIYILSFIGRNAMTIYVTHFLFIALCSKIIPHILNFTYTNNTLYYILLYSIFVFTEIPLVYIFNKKQILWIIGK